MESVLNIKPVLQELQVNQFRSTTILMWILTIVGIFFGLFAWIAFIMGIFAIVKMHQYANPPKKILLIIGMLVSGIFGAIKSIMGILVRSGIGQG